MSSYRAYKKNGNYYDNLVGRIVLKILTEGDRYGKIG